jgi:hypothetical protein
MAKTVDEIISSLYAAADTVVPALKSSFLDAIRELQSNQLSIADLEAAILNGNIDGAISASQIDKLDDLLFGIGMNNDAYVFTTQMQSAFYAGAYAAISNLVATKQTGIAFNPLNERAIIIMRTKGLQTVTGITTTTRDGIRAIITRQIQDGINPNKAAKEIRQLIGLTDSQMQAVTNFRRQLEAQSNLGFTPASERRLSAVEQSVVRRHMKDGNLDKQSIDNMVDRYYQSLLNKRATDIARTESMSAVNAGQSELWQQGLDLGIFDDNVDRKFWIVTPDDRLRATHAAIPNMNPFGVKIRAMFITPFGPVFSPGDYNSGLINCRCVLVLGEVGQVLNY